MSSTVEFFAILHPAEGKTDKLRTLLHELAEKTQAEDKDCLGYQLLEVIDKGKLKFEILEKWPSQAALDVHLERDWLKSVNRAFEEEHLLEGEEILVPCKSIGGFAPPN